MVMYIPAEKPLQLSPPVRVMVKPLKFAVEVTGAAERYCTSSRSAADSATRSSSPIGCTARLIRRLPPDWPTLSCVSSVTLLPTTSGSLFTGTVSVTSLISPTPNAFSSSLSVHFLMPWVSELSSGAVGL